MIAENLARIHERIAAAAQKGGRDPKDVTLVAVSKTFSAERVAEAHRAGQRHFGENRVQEGVAKIEKAALADATWHLVGHLQTNKAKPAARSFDVIESVDSQRVAEALSSEATKLGRTLDALIEVNVGAEESKFGLDPKVTAAATVEIAKLAGLRVVGLMTVAPYADDAEQVRPIFRAMRRLGDLVRQELGNPERWHLSMGMSGDFEVAIQEGATMVRIGRAIFGERV